MEYLVRHSPAPPAPRSARRWRLSAAAPCLKRALDGLTAVKRRFGAVQFFGISLDGPLGIVEDQKEGLGLKTERRPLLWLFVLISGVRPARVFSQETAERNSQ